VTPQERSAKIEEALRVSQAALGWAAANELDPIPDIVTQALDMARAALAVVAEEPAPVCANGCVEKGYPEIDCPVHGMDAPAPPAEQGCPACGGSGAFYDRDHHKCVACGAIGGTWRAKP
jgi:hypothetical protein